MASEYIRRRRYAEAEREYQAVIKVVPTNFYPYLKLGDLKLAQGKVREAEELYSKALVLSKRFPYAYAKLGTLYLMQNSPDRALPLLRQAEKYAASGRDFDRQSRGRLHYALAVAPAQTGKGQEAVREARIARSLLPNDPAVQQLLKQLGVR